MKATTSSAHKKTHSKTTATTSVQGKNNIPKKQVKKRIKSKNAKALILTAVVFGIVSLFAATYAYSASVTQKPEMLLEASTASVTVGNPFTIRVYSDSDTVSVNAVRALVTYPTDLVRLEKVNADDSQYPIRAFQQNHDDSVEVVRGVVGGVTGKKLVAELQFVAIKQGNSQIGFNALETMLVDSTNNANILKDDSFNNVTIEVK